ncbi:MAG: hypothetical protein COV99_05790 [Bacteroidetes bacterium CG12_big_fil_rev_8_21_14_0_65_60_17]|nr:MAG: hypothetical protein COV99_05790 [Bacteroidetes bacterium CG12_big_fil_rev_8_21_14_0_65_60_17]
MRYLFTVLAGLMLLALPASAQFGGSMVVSGDQILAGVAGGPVSSGAVHVYTHSGSGIWTEVSAVRPSSSSELNDGFGRALSIDGNRLAVGAPGTKSVYLFEKGANGSWTQTNRIQGDVDGFGGAVALDGDHLLVAVPGGFRNSGSVYAYHTMGGEWMATGMLEVDSEEPIPSYAASMTLKDGHAVVGAPFANQRAGAAYAFRFDMSSHGWTPNGSPAVSFVGGGSSFGGSLLLVDNETLLVGMAGHDGRMGAVTVFSSDPETGEWGLEGRISPANAAPGDGFGSVLAVHDGMLYVGATGAGESGAIFSMALSDLGSTGAGMMTLTPADVPEGAGFGGNLAVSDQVLAVAASGMDNRSGRVIPFVRSGNDWSQGQSFFRDPDGYASVTGGTVECTDGEAGAFPCKDVNMLSFMNMEDLGADRGIRTNDIWGWEDPETGREYAIVGLSNQTSFVDVTNPENPILVGELDKTETARTSVWRDMKVYKDHAFIVADGAGQHGMQIFDLRQLRSYDGDPIQFEMTAYYDQIASAHNIVINEETGYAYSVGSSSGGTTCGGGLHMINIQDPVNPVFAGCFQDNNTGRRGTGYSHDAQCVMYRGPDSDYAGREICLGSNETALSIADVTDKKNPVAIAYATYPNVAYAHQGWLTEDHRYFYMNDEGDEPQGLVEGTRTLIWDLADLDEPQLVGEYIATTTETDHNLYVRDNIMYQSNYGAGFRVLDVSNPETPVEIGYFDTSPVGGGGGSWSNYPYFRSGTIVVTGGSSGLFIVKKKEIDT